MEKLLVEDSFWGLFPDSAIGVIIARNLKSSDQVSPEDKAAIASDLIAANERANQHLTSNTISENEVVRVWRDAFQKFKTKKGARSSIENLLKRVLKGNPVGSITPSVDIYNTISLKYALPVGGEDIDTIVGTMYLGITKGGDTFVPIGENENDPSLPGELCYFDDEGAICRCWNWRDGQRTALTDDSKNALLVIECIDPRRIDDVKMALEEFASLMQRYFKAEIESISLLTKDNPCVVCSTS